jgi:hypothetical protein
MWFAAPWHPPDGQAQAGATRSDKIFIPRISPRLRHPVIRLGVIRRLTICRFLPSLACLGMVLAPMMVPAASLAIPPA